MSKLKALFSILLPTVIVSSIFANTEGVPVCIYSYAGAKTDYYGFYSANNTTPVIHPGNSNWQCLIVPVAKKQPATITINRADNHERVCTIVLKTGFNGTTSTVTEHPEHCSKKDLIFYPPPVLDHQNKNVSSNPKNALDLPYPNYPGCSKKLGQYVECTEIALGW